MALRSRSLFTYGFEVTTFNRFISFGTTVLEFGPSARTATLNIGFYSLTDFAAEIVRALTEADPAHTYTVSVDRTIAGGTQNRVTISTSGSFLSIFFSSGNISSPASLLGFNIADYTGSTTYTGSTSAGILYSPSTIGYSYLSPHKMKKNFGTSSISASGIKEAITFQLQQFWQVQFRYLPNAETDPNWEPLVIWMIQQKPIEYTPEVIFPLIFFAGTLEEPNQGMEMMIPEQLSEKMPFFFNTPLMKFRVAVS